MWPIGDVMTLETQSGSFTVSKVSVSAPSHLHAARDLFELKRVQQLFQKSAC